MTQQQLLILGGAAVVLLWPQLSGFFKSFASTPSIVLKPAPVGAPSKMRAEWLGELMQLQDILRGAGRTKAADLCSQLCVELISGDTKPSQGK